MSRFLDWLSSLFRAPEPEEPVSDVVVFKSSAEVTTSSTTKSPKKRSPKKKKPGRKPGLKKAKPSTSDPAKEVKSSESPKKRVEKEPIIVNIIDKDEPSST